MSEQRFENRLNRESIYFNTLNPVWDNKKQDGLNVFEMIDMLNDLYRQKERYKRLSEIRDEKIDNYILTIKEFRDNCPDDKVKDILNDLFYSELNEYDISKECRELKKELETYKEVNNKLQKKITELVEKLHD